MYPTPYEETKFLGGGEYEVVETSSIILVQTNKDELFVFDKILDFREIDTATQFMYRYRKNFYLYINSDKTKLFYIKNGVRQYSRPLNTYIE